jgi:hypothetical protein
MYRLKNSTGLGHFLQAGLHLPVPVSMIPYHPHNIVHIARMICGFNVVPCPIHARQPQQAPHKKSLITYN